MSYCIACGVEINSITACSEDESVCKDCYSDFNGIFEDTPFSKYETYPQSDGDEYQDC